jgi:hypothetical protein
MSFIDQFKRLLGMKPRPEPENTELIYIYLPEALDPEDRELHYGEPIDAELKLRRLGYVSGGGTMQSAEKEDGSREIEFCGVDVDSDDVRAACQFLREYLPVLGCHPGTRLEYRSHGVDLQDEYDGESWTLERPSPVHPDFDSEPE